MGPKSMIFSTDSKLKIQWDLQVNCSSIIPLIVLEITTFFGLFKKIIRYLIDDTYRMLQDTLSITIDKKSLSSSFGICGSIEETAYQKSAEVYKDFGGNVFSTNCRCLRKIVPPWLRKFYNNFKYCSKEKTIRLLKKYYYCYKTFNTRVYTYIFMFKDSCEIQDDQLCLNRETERRAEKFCNGILTEVQLSPCRKVRWLLLIWYRYIIYFSLRENL